jgi:hypothetical protein
LPIQATTVQDKGFLVPDGSIFVKITLFFEQAIESLVAAVFSLEAEEVVFELEQTLLEQALEGALKLVFGQAFAFLVQPPNNIFFAGKSQYLDCFENPAPGIHT